MSRLSRFPMLRPTRICLLIACLAGTAAGPGPLAAREAGPPGPVATLGLALRLYERAAADGDALGMAVAVRLATSIRLREAMGWTKESGRSGATASGDGSALTSVETSGLTLDLLVSDAALSGALLMAEEDEALSDLLYELPPVVLRGGVSRAQDRVNPGARDSWTIPFAGLSPAEIAVFAASDPDAPEADGEGTAPRAAIFWAVEDITGATLCPMRPVADSACSFTPTENGFYRVVIDNPTALAAPYMLVTN